MENKLLINTLKSLDLPRLFEEHTMPFKELMAYYRCAMMEVSTKFNVLNEELSLKYDRNPIETIKTRLKSTDSILKKLAKKGIKPTPQNIEQQINDIAGIRVICAFPSDAYMLADALISQDDIVLIEKKDYIATPKPNGYRSLHLIVEIPIFLHNMKKAMRVEVQLRTISMDWWASLEHKIRYKKNVNISKEIDDELLMCAELGAGLDKKMEELHFKVDALSEAQKKV